MKIRDGDTVELLESTQTLKDRGRAQRTLPPGTRAMVERQAHGILRLVVEDASPADGLHDAAIVGSSQVRRVE